MGPTPEGEAFLVLDNEDSFGFSMGRVAGGHRQVLFTESRPTGLFDEAAYPLNGCRVVPSVLRHGGGFEGLEGS